jgi:hypothetical protein
MKIKRIQLTIGTKFWDEETETSTKTVLKTLNLNRENIISIDSDEKGVWLYYFEI